MYKHCAIVSSRISRRASVVRSSTSIFDAEKEISTFEHTLHRMGLPAVSLMVQGVRRQCDDLPVLENNHLRCRRLPRAPPFSSRHRQSGGQVPGEAISRDFEASRSRRRSSLHRLSSVKQGQVTGHSLPP